MIPKIIHYCWFGHNPLPESAKKCIESWKKYFPDYEIKEWNEENFNVRCCRYVQEAYDEKKYAFVSDYARFFILYNHGGLYFDTDVEVISSFEDILKEGQFMGCEIVSINNGEVLGINPGLGMAAEKGDAVLKTMLLHYESESFLNKDKQIITIVKRTTDLFEKEGYNIHENAIQKILEYRIYSTEYFAPLNVLNHQLLVTHNTHSIHNYSATWITPEEQKISEIIDRSKQIAGIHYILCKIQIQCLRIINSLKVHGFKKTLRKLFKAIRKRGA